VRGSSSREGHLAFIAIGLANARVRGSSDPRVSSVAGWVCPPADPTAIIRPVLNYIWFGLMAIALVVAAVNGTADAVTKGAVESASTAVQIAIGLVGVMTLWLGMMRVAEAAGLVTVVGHALRPILRWMFPEVPPGHPAAGAIVVALAANMLGLNNAATPLGIKAMEELQTLNPDKDTATNSMVTLMAVTTSGVQLIPATMIGVLAAAGSLNPTVIIGTSLVATFVGTLAAVLTARLLQRFYAQTATPTEVRS
jgi:spore maturation protein A